MSRPEPASSLPFLGAGPLVLAEVLDRCAHEVAIRSSDLILSELPVYVRGGDALRLETQTRTELRLHWLFGSVREGRFPTTPHNRVREGAMRRLQQGIPLDVVLRAYRLVSRLLWEVMLREAARLPEGNESLAALMSVVMGYVDAEGDELATVYIREQQELTADDDRTRRDVLERLLAGEAPPSHFMARVWSVETDACCLVMIATLLGQALDGQIALHRLARSIALDPEWTAAPRPLIVARQQEIVGFFPLGRLDDRELCRRIVSVMRRLAGQHRLPLGIGVSLTCDGLDRLPQGYDQAVDAARRTTPDSPVLALPQLPLWEYLALRADPAACPRNRLRSLIEGDDPAHRSLLETVVTYAHTNRNVNAAGTQLLVHPNTVLHRLRRVEDLTGLDPRRAMDLIELMTAIAVLNRSALHPDPIKGGVHAVPPMRGSG
ncbi:PucR family transcriptional regulator [Frankia sp. Cr1]|uniref:PucR family transcriptional regulator n=1 Tax=Frankia sp. Cr1 TaxID=3073931 RepID=UPI002AD26A3A|nr:helix-turn-helix domain-containing protein [Frankia sp. Cr1]